MLEPTIIPSIITDHKQKIAANEYLHFISCYYLLFQIYFNRENFRRIVRLRCFRQEHLNQLGKVTYWRFGLCYLPEVCRSVLPYLPGLYYQAGGYCRHFRPRLNLNYQTDYSGQSCFHFCCHWYYYH